MNTDILLSGGVLLGLTLLVLGILAVGGFFDPK